MSARHQAELARSVTAAVLSRVEMLAAALDALRLYPALRRVAEVAATLDPHSQSKTATESVRELAHAACSSMVVHDDLVHDAVHYLEAELSRPVLLEELARAYAARRGRFVDDDKRYSWCIACGRNQVLALDGVTTCPTCIMERMGA